MLIEPGVHDKVQVWRRIGRPYSLSACRTESNSRKPNVEFWGAIGIGVKSDLVFAHSTTYNEERGWTTKARGEPNFNAVKYAALIAEHMPAILNQMRALHGSCLVMKTTLQFVQNRSGGARRVVVSTLVSSAQQSGSQTDREKPGVISRLPSSADTRKPRARRVGKDPSVVHRQKDTRHASNCTQSSPRQVS